MIIKCPSCDKESEVGADTAEEAEGATLDCAWCSTLLIFNEGKVIDFHVHMNNQDPRWPKDGQGAHSVSI